MPNTKKVSAVADLQKNLTEQPNVTLIGFDKTKHTALETLRKTVRKAGGTVLVSKTSLLEKAIERVPAMKAFKEKALPIKNNTALVSLSGDWSAGLKAIHEFAKKETSVMFKFGFFDSVVFDKSSLERLAQLPSKLELLGKLVGSFKSPIYRVDTAIKFPMTYFVQVLKAKAQKAE